MTSSSGLVFLLCLALACFSATTQAQVTRSPSIDPLGGSSFTTPTFAPASTFTPTTTFASASGRVGTAISGPGPSVTTPSYTFSYQVPSSTVPGTNLAGVYSSLAANGTPTAATSALVPDQSNLQIVNQPTTAAASSNSNAAASLRGTTGGLSAMAGALAAGAVIVALA